MTIIQQAICDASGQPYPLDTLALYTEGPDLVITLRGNPVTFDDLDPGCTALVEQFIAELQDRKRCYVPKPRNGGGE